ncbi:Arm DNA-binding domain-containing protein [Asticcacaulis sp.]|uniref:Arm DNA-binding domain-containing protein n=1 Tax=Asticcacaulis sp. TaxID=1872648 RepID=UPI0031E434CF
MRDPQMSLSDAAIRSAKSKSAEYKLFDEGGLFLLIKPSGSKLWRFKYRINGKEMALALGSYPATGLKDARKARDDAKELLEKGGDPSAEKKRQAVAASIAAANRAQSVDQLRHLPQPTSLFPDQRLTDAKHIGLPDCVETPPLFAPLQIPIPHRGKGQDGKG